MTPRTRLSILGTLAVIGALAIGWAAGQGILWVVTR